MQKKENILDLLYLEYVPIFRPEPVLAKWSTVHRESRNARACTGGDGAKRTRRQQMARQGSAAICATVAVHTNGLRCQCQGDGEKKLATSGRGWDAVPPQDAPSSGATAAPPQPLTTP
jgi:hypothetical protein